MESIPSEMIFNKMLNFVNTLPGHDDHRSNMFIEASLDVNLDFFERLQDLVRAAWYAGETSCLESGRESP